jgi:hypothetical protein
MCLSCRFRGRPHGHRRQEIQLEAERHILHSVLEVLPTLCGRLRGPVLVSVRRQADAARVGILQKGWRRYRNSCFRLRFWKTMYNRVKLIGVSIPSLHVELDMWLLDDDVQERKNGTNA